MVDLVEELAVLLRFVLVDSDLRHKLVVLFCNFFKFLDTVLRLAK